MSSWTGNHWLDQRLDSICGLVVMVVVVVVVTVIATVLVVVIGR